MLVFFNCFSEISNTAHKVSSSSIGSPFSGVDEHPAEVKRRKEEQRAAELEALKKRVTPGDFVWLKIGYTVRKLKVTGVTDESIYAGNMKFSIKALDDALFTGARYFAE